jgi:dehydrogenase/reductase SDR family protein 7
VVLYPQLATLCVIAGASQHALASETTGEVAQQLLEINTLAPIKLTQAVLPYMLKR